MKVEFKKEFILGRSQRRASAEKVGPGDVRDLPAWQATELADRGIARLLDVPTALPVDIKKREEYVRGRLETMDKAVVLGKLERSGVKVPKGLDKPGLIDLYVAEVDPKAKPAAKPKEEKGSGK